MKRIQVLVVFDAKDDVDERLVERGLQGALIAVPSVGPIKIGFAAIPLDTRHLIIEMLAQQIEQDGQKLPFSACDEPYQDAGDTILEAALDLVP